MICARAYRAVNTPEFRAHLDDSLSQWLDFWEVECCIGHAWEDYYG